MKTKIMALCLLCCFMVTGGCSSDQPAQQESQSVRQSKLPPGANLKFDPENNTLSEEEEVERMGFLYKKDLRRETTTEEKSELKQIRDFRSERRSKSLHEAFEKRSKELREKAGEYSTLDRIGEI